MIFSDFLEKIQNFSYKLPNRYTHVTTGNNNYIQASTGINDSNKEKHFSNQRMPNPIQQIRNKRNNTGYVNNIGIKTKEYFSNEPDMEIQNFQANTGKNIRTNLTYDVNSNCESKNKRPNVKINKLLNNNYLCSFYGLSTNSHLFLF